MAAPDESSELGAALDELYGVQPEDFVATRTRLAADRRAAGDTAGAKIVQAARKPTTAAWAMNQLRRQAPDQLDEFVDRSRELRGADRDTLRAALAGQRQAFTEATEAALAILGDRANDGYRARITATLHAATADESLAAELERGRLVREVTEAGFPADGIAASPPPSGRAPKPRPTPASGPAKERADARAERARAAEQAAQEERTRRQEDAESAWRDAEAAAREATAAAERATFAVEQRKAELDEARREQRAAADRARRTRQELERRDAARNRLR